MLWIANFIFIILALIVAVSVAWRFACRKWVLPWPSWLAFMMENPYMLVVNHSSDVVRRLPLKDGLRVLEVGCGSGRILVPIARKIIPRGKAFGLDIQPKMLSKAQRRSRLAGVDIFLQNCDLMSGSIAAEDLDLVVLVTVIGEFPDRHLALREISSKLKPGGILSITEVIPDPCYLPRSVIKGELGSLGFEVCDEFVKMLSYTVNFKKL